MSASGAEERVETWRRWHADEVPLRLGVSSCLDGEAVRFDGGHARDRFVTDVLGRWFERVRVCPEVEVGMGVPRPTVRLVDEGEGVRLVAPSSGEDYTQRMERFAAKRIDELRRLDLDGFVLKKNSPSCGLERLSVYRRGARASKAGVGLFARALVERWPQLPIEEEGRLNDPALRENFIERAFCRNRWRAFVHRGPTRRRLVEFHTAHKLLLLAHDERAYRALGRVVAGAGERPDRELYASYEAGFQAALRARGTPRRHANVLQHALGHLKRHLDAREKRELLAAIEDHRRGLLPLVVPITLLRFNVVKHEIAYLRDQLYFEPHPKELLLRNHV